MRKQELQSVDVKLAKRPQACQRYGMCWNVLLKAAQDANAVVRYGRSVFINVPVLDRYFDALSE